MWTVGRPSAITPDVSDSLKSMLVARLPQPVRGRLLRLRKPIRRARYRIRKRVQPAAVTRQDIAEALRRAGLRAGDGAFVHSALSSLGHVEGGPAAVIGAFDDVLGPEGLLAMPSFPYVGGTAEFLATDPVFDVRETPSCMGAVTEHFRRLPGTARSLHPTHPVCARGAGAAELLAGHADAGTPFGEGTPYARMVERGMHQVWLGVAIKTFTLYHTFECLKGDAFPVRVFLGERVPARCVDEHGAERVVPTLVHDPDVSRHKDRTRAELRRRLAAAGVLRSTEIGRATLMAAPMPALMEELDVLLGDGIDIYDREALAAEGALA
jgi:aminoglycoside 3-N-acetyltransferase